MVGDEKVCKVVVEEEGNALRLMCVPDTPLIDFESVYEEGVLMTANAVAYDARFCIEFAAQCF